MAKHKAAFYACDGSGCEVFIVWRKDETPPNWKKNRSFGASYGISEEYFFCEKCCKDENQHPYVKGAC